ncbi:c-type cytochrome domain-containing protein [uncultured Gimesia sp.]|uniref:c-type cytochrome domain-containing protein n=1 Tax=uncultured Gimesia sp. TaxID=1678688 RepID=UPI002616114D|nr:c-type cytochrome domain-containing protein [uncultured Gimesia sp.]
MLLFIFSSFSLQTNFAEDKIPVFESDIRPVLAAKCGKCHRDEVRKGGLNLSSIDGLHRGGESEESAIAETLDESLLWTMIADGDMPPEGQPQLTKAERDLIQQWIITGARSKKPHQPKIKTITQHDVLPIMLLRCTTCHGARLKKGGLDLRTPESMRKGGDHGPALISGNPSGSLMIQRIESNACPPRELLLKFFVKRPPRSEVNTLREWIAAKAPVVDHGSDAARTKPDPLVTEEDRRHWAFQPPHAPPGVTSIDHLVRKKLQEQGLDLSPISDRNTLIRRAYLDLTGIPPAIEEWNRWHSSKDPHWYQTMIDHLLPHFPDDFPRFGT